MPKAIDHKSSCYWLEWFQYFSEKAKDENIEKLRPGQKPSSHWASVCKDKAEGK